MTFEKQLCKHFPVLRPPVVPRKQLLSHRISFKMSTPPQNCQLIVWISNSEQKVDDFVGQLTLWNQLINTLCKISWVLRPPVVPCNPLSCQDYLRESACKVVLQKLIAAKIRQIFHYDYSYNQWVDGFVRGWTLAKQPYKHFLWDEGANASHSAHY